MKRPGRILVLAGLFFVVSAAAQAQALKPAPGPKAPVAAKAPAAAKPDAVDPALLKPATLNAKAPEIYEVKVDTTLGEFIIDVTRKWAPQGADRFYNLVLHHFYDGASFFRVVPDFMVQFGLSADPQVSKAWDKATIKDDPVTQTNDRGYITFATSGPNSRTTQVFINFKNNANLDKMGFAPFGVVADGMDIVDNLYDGYGDGPPEGKGPDQEMIKTRGQAYLEQKFPKLDKIKTIEIVDLSQVPQEPREPANEATQ